jgi:hypothetical protein
VNWHRYWPEAAKWKSVRCESTRTDQQSESGPSLKVHTTASKHAEDRQEEEEEEEEEEEDAEGKNKKPFESRQGDYRLKPTINLYDQRQREREREKCKVDGAPAHKSPLNRDYFA